jgi:hypothetical protein
MFPECDEASAELTELDREAACADEEEEAAAAAALDEDATESRTVV